MAKLVAVVALYFLVILGDFLVAGWTWIDEDWALVASLADKLAFDLGSGTLNACSVVVVFAAEASQQAFRLIPLVTFLTYLQ